MTLLHRISGAALLCIIAGTAHGGAWTQEKGQGQVILNGWYYSADKLYDNQGDKASQPDYDKYELNPYGEYGLTDTLTLGANLSLQRAHQDTSPDQTNWGIGESEVFLRGRLWQRDSLVISAEPMVKLPVLDSSDDRPKLGGSHPDIGMGLSAGYGFTCRGFNHFANLDTQYRHRLGDAKDQIKLAATLGYSLDAQWVVMPQIFMTWRTSSPSAASFTQSSADDYNLTKLQLSAVYKLNDDTSLQLGGFGHVDGKNVGAGGGALVAVWKTF